ncbi:hypothetical protein BDN72DRAFT_901635 [Pluteus cervinus]|uniref:Uncharacterized protein n=1 Tax=Pluteus cervinus TaxID=181527 RepID=A0ACD3AEL6_9AGAR|nr:hypothetical protein BDN72DRAFT_901635 [Pluteus cervinus]
MLPDLPPEIWLEIMRMSTEILQSDLLSTEVLATEFANRSYKKRYKALRDSLVIKRFLVRVCKQWNALATPLLYESIFIGRGRVLRSLCTTLQTQPVGQWTKRLDVAMRDYSTGLNARKSKTAVDFEHIATIIRSLPNIQTLNFCLDIESILFPMPGSIIQVISETCGPRLKVLQFYGEGYQPHYLDIPGLLAHTPNLVVFRSTSYLDLEPSWDSASESTEIHLPYLSSLYISTEHCGLIQNFPTLDAPSLRHIVTVGKFSNYTPPSPALLTHIQFVEDLTIMDLHEFVDMVRENCPEIKRIDTYLWHWGTAAGFPHYLTLPPPLQILGLSFRDRGATKGGYAHFLSAISTLVFGNDFRSVRLLEKRNLDDLGFSHPVILKELVEVLNVIGVGLEDGEGHAVD